MPGIKVEGKVERKAGRALWAWETLKGPGFSSSTNEKTVGRHDNGLQTYKRLLQRDQTVVDLIRNKGETGQISTKNDVGILRYALRTEDGLADFQGLLSASVFCDFFNATFNKTFESLQKQNTNISAALEISFSVYV